MFDIISQVDAILSDSFTRNLIIGVEILGAHEYCSGHPIPRSLQRMHDQELVNKNKYAFGRESGSWRRWVRHREGKVGCWGAWRVQKENRG